MKYVLTIVIVGVLCLHFWIQIERQNLAVVESVIKCADTYEGDAYSICQKYAVKAGIFNE